MTGRGIRRCGLTGVACVSLLAVTARAEELDGFRERPWGTPWDAAAIASLPGCEGQGNLVTDVEGYVALVAQPECVGYPFAERERVTLILFYPEIPWHSPEHARRVVGNTLAHWRMWGLTRKTVARLERAAVRLDGIVTRRRLHGSAAPMFPNAGARALPQEATGLQGYQISFTAAAYDAVRSTVVQDLGPATERSRDPTGGETLTWAGTRTFAILRERIGGGAGGAFAMVTTAYLRALSAGATVAGAKPLWANALSRPWVLEIVEWFAWARDR